MKPTRMLKTKENGKQEEIPVKKAGGRSKKWEDWEKVAETKEDRRKRKTKKMKPRRLPGK